MKRYLIIITFIILLVMGCNNAGVQTSEYKSISPQDLKKMINTKDSNAFLLVDVHIPEQARIEKTDFFVPYNEIKENKDKFGKDKNKKIVLYCFGGGMGREAAQALLDMGYTDVSNLSGGTMAWKDAGYSVEE